MKIKMLSLALVLAIVGVSETYAVKLNKPVANPSSYDQIIQTVNLLTNPNLDSNGSTASPVDLQYFIGPTLCWDTRYKPVNYKNFDNFGTCSICGCKQNVTKVVITPKPPIGKVKPIYSPYTVDINADNKITGTQIIIIQDQAPFFNPNNGEVEKVGTIKIIKQDK